MLREQRVCVVCWGDNQGRRLENTTRMVMLDQRGYPCDVLCLPQLSGHIPNTPIEKIKSLEEDERKAADFLAIRDFLQKHWPHLIVIGTTNIACWQLMQDIEHVKDAHEWFKQVRHLKRCVGCCAVAGSGRSYEDLRCRKTSSRTCRR
jgi:hypothetical protein